MPPSPTYTLQRKSPFPTRFHRAFTLVELLTVIAIIGILAAILIPTVGKVRESARRAACASNLRQIGVAVRLYTDENKGDLPIPNSDWQNGRGYWMGRLAPYLEGWHGSTSKTVQLRENFGGIFRCPAKTDFDLSTDADSSIGIDYYRVSYRMQVWKKEGSDYQKRSGTIKMASVPTPPARTLCVTDGSRSVQISDPDQMYTRADTLALRHGGRDNVLFLDGHVELIGKEGIVLDPDGTRFLVKK